MKPRHLNMISIGGAIGDGFFVGSGKALLSGVSGPCFLSCVASFSQLVKLALSESLYLYYASLEPGLYLNLFLSYRVIIFNIGTLAFFTQTSFKKT